MKIEEIARSMTPIALQGIDDNLRKMLMLITFTEGTDHQKTPYNELFGYDNFTSFDTHPNILVNKNNYKSTAAGRYQILFRTYKQLGAGLFTPERQDWMCTELLKWNHSTQFVLNANWASAIKSNNRTWASLPGSPYGQPVYKYEDCLKFISYLD